MHQHETKPFRPGYEKIVSHGRVWSERLNSTVLPFSLVPTSLLMILSAVMFTSTLVVLTPMEKVTEKAVNYLANRNTSARIDKAALGTPRIVFGLSPTVYAVEQVSELKNDVAQALVALETNNNTPFTDFPADLMKGSYDPTRFALKKVSATTAFLAIPVGHFMKYTDQSVYPPATKYRLVDGSYVDTPAPGALKNRADSLFIAALHRENGKWVAYNFQPDHVSSPLEQIDGMPQVTQEMIRKSFDAAFIPLQK